MKLLRAADLDLEPPQTVFRHGRVVPVVAVVAFAAITCAGAWFAPRVWHEVSNASSLLPWLVALPFALVCGLAWLGACSLALDVARAARLPSNWVLRVAGDGVYVNVRSYLNAHFDEDGPTVAWIPIADVSRVRDVTERVDTDSDVERPTRRWIDLELDGVDTAELAARCDHERSRKGPPRRFLFVTSRMRFDHVPVQVPRPGVVRVERVESRMSEVLARWVPRAEGVVSGPKTIPADLDARVLELCRAGRRLDAIALARRERGGSLAAAREYVEITADASRVA